MNEISGYVPAIAWALSITALCNAIHVAFIIARDLDKRALARRGKGEL